MSLKLRAQELVSIAARVLINQSTRVVKVCILSDGVIQIQFDTPLNVCDRCASIANLESLDWESKASTKKQQQPEFSLFHSNILYGFSFAGETKIVYQYFLASAHKTKPFFCASRK